MHIGLEFISSGARRNGIATAQDCPVRTGRKKGVRKQSSSNAQKERGRYEQSKSEVSISTATTER